jgi:hypothetical protein
MRFLQKIKEIECGVRFLQKIKESSAMVKHLNVEIGHNEEYFRVFQGLDIIT